MLKSIEKRRAYHRQWYAANRDKLKDKENAKSPEEKAAKRARKKQLYNQNAIRVNEQRRAKYARMKQEHPEIHAELKRREYRRAKERDAELLRERARRGSARYRAAHPDRRPSKETMKESGKRARLRLRIMVLSHYGGKCACCGESRIEFLCIDHENNNGAAHRREMGVTRGSGPIYRWLKTHGFPAGFRVLCHNCNMSIGFYGYCPHQRQAAIAS